jgi:hypothetical protein
MYSSPRNVGNILVSDLRYPEAIATFEVKQGMYTNIGKLRSVDTLRNRGRWDGANTGIGQLHIADLDPGALDSFTGRNPTLAGRVWTQLMTLKITDLHQRY